MHAVHLPYTCPAVQQVGVALSVGLAVISHPWLWTWFVPRYYMILVGIVVVIVLNKVGTCHLTAFQLGCCGALPVVATLPSPPSHSCLTCSRS